MALQIFFHRQLVPLLSTRSSQQELVVSTVKLSPYIKLENNLTLNCLL